MELFNQWNRQDPVSSALQGRSVNIPMESSFDYAILRQTPVTETIENKDALVMEAAPEAQSAPLAESEIVNMKDFSYEGYQVVRGEFFAHVYEPSITFNRNKITFNTSCLRKLPDVEYVQFIDRVSCKSADRLRDDVIYFPGQRIVDHRHELFSFFRAQTGDAVVGINLHKLPIRSVTDVPGIIIDLCVVAACLFIRIGRDAGVCCYTALARRRGG